MRTIAETRKKWDTLFSNAETIDDFRKALKSEEQGNLCDEGLRSICWKALLLYDNLDLSTWPQRISDSRSAYSSLKDHFLKYIEHPDNLDSTVDPLAEDEESPWQSLRRDEAIRAEIFQDVERCLQENYFFREPYTKSMMLDILFIYSKLNPDLGYRQGMHELLAPVLWVVDRDAIDKESLENADLEGKRNLMLQSLDSTYVEHDSFGLFCSIMQTVRIYYEHSEPKSFAGQAEIAPIVSRCQNIHQNVLMAADYELAKHLHAIEVLPQIFLTRWVRLLFGREFSFDDVLLIWDLLFAESLRLNLIDYTCVAMLLRIRWQLLEADYSSALTLLLRYPPLSHAPQTLVRDGLYLEQNLTPARGAFIISKYSGRPLEFSKIPRHHHVRSLSGNLESSRGDVRNFSTKSSPGRSPARINLEALFQDVSEGFQRRTEAWGVAKAVRGAVTEARRTIIQPDGTSNLARPWNNPRVGSPPSQVGGPNPVDLVRKIEFLGQRNKTLAEVLGDALSELRMTKEDSPPTPDANPDEAFNRALAKIQSVQNLLEDQSIQTPTERTKDTDSGESNGEQTIASPRGEQDQNTPEAKPLPPEEETTSASPIQSAATGKNVSQTEAVTVGLPAPPASLRHSSRPSLEQTGFSWMLGDSVHRSSFVSSSSLLPEQSRQGDVRYRPTPLFSGGSKEQGRGKVRSEDDGLLLSSLRGGHNNGSVNNHDPDQ